jgi:pilus assembly protein Flp/PilA
MFESTRERIDLRHDEDGQALVEYGLVLALLAVVAIGALVFLGSQVASILSTIGNNI